MLSGRPVASLRLRKNIVILSEEASDHKCVSGTQPRTLTHKSGEDTFKRKLNNRAAIIEIRTTNDAKIDLAKSMFSRVKLSKRHLLELGEVAVCSADNDY